MGQGEMRYQSESSMVECESDESDERVKSRR